MKKIAIQMVVLLFLMGVAVAAFAQEKAKTEAVKQPSGAMEEFRVGGIIKEIDPVAGKITIQQQKVKRERTVSLRLEKKMMERASVFGKGDAVNVWVKGNTVFEIEKIPDPVWEEIKR